MRHRKMYSERARYVININIIKKKAFKINANIEDGRLKKYGNKNWSLNFHEQPKSQNPTYCFFF